MISDETKRKIIEKLNKYYYDEKFDTDEDRDFFMEFQYELLEQAIQDDRPKDILNFVDKQLKKQDYDRQLDAFSNAVISKKSGDSKAIDKLRANIDDFLEKAEKEFPGYKKERSIAISELMGDLLALSTKGFAGSSRMVGEIKRKEAKSKGKEKQSNR